MNKRLYKKAFRDLFSDRRKALVAISAVMAGMIAFGTVLFAYEIIVGELVTTYSSINPISASINVSRIDSRFLALTEEFSDIAQYDVKADYELRGQKANGEWTTAQLFASEDYTDIGLNKVFHMEGSMNPGPDEMLIERDAMRVAEKGIGDVLLISMPDGSEKELKITGVINDLGVHPATMHGTIYAYVSAETLEDMGLYPNRIDFKLKENPYDRQTIVTTGNEYMRMLERNGYRVNKLTVENMPGISMHLEEYKTTLFLLRAFAFAAFLFGCLIMCSLITSILSQQVRQIGILKSFGTRSASITGSYLLALFAFIGTAGLVSLPLSKMLSDLLSALLLRISNMSLSNKQVPVSLYGFFLAVCFAVPIVIAFLAIRRAAKLSVKDAISNAAVSGGTGKPWLTELSCLPRPVMLTIRNAVRRKGRFILNVFTLAVSGACFITVFTAMFSVSAALTENMNTFGYDYRFIPGDTEEQIGQALMECQDIRTSEYWGYTVGRFLYQNGEIGNSHPIFAVPKDSGLVAPQLLAGTWLHNDGTGGIVAGHEFMSDYPELSLGDTITLDIDGAGVTLPIIGVIKDFSGKGIYMEKRFFEQSVPPESSQTIVQIRLDSRLRGRSKANVIQKLEDSLLHQGISILQSETKANAIKILNSHHMATFQTLLIVILMVLLISAFGLSSTVNIQTLERMREIGIMKSIGADQKQIIKIITSESVFVGLSGWVLSVICSVPGITAGLAFLGKMTLEVPVTRNIAALLTGYGIWLLMVLFIGRKASKRPALRAAGMTIKEAMLFGNE